MESKNTTKVRILRTAAKLFAKQGFSATSVSDIVRAAKTTKGGLYHHFSSKEELFVAAVGTIIGKCPNSHIDPLVEMTKKEYIQRLYEYGYSILDNYQKDPMVGDLQWEIVNQMRKNPRVRKVMQSIYVALKKERFLFIEKGIELGVFHKSVDKHYLFAKMSTMIDVLGTYVAVDIKMFDCKEIWKRTVDEMLQVKS